MALTVDKLINEERFSGDNAIQFLLYLPFGVCLLVFRIFLALILWVASIILPNKSAVRQMLSTLACWTFGVYVKVKGTRDPRCSVMVANYVSCLDSLAASHVLGTISLRKWKVPPFFASTLGIRNAAQFVRKQHFAECPSKPVLLQPEGGPTNGRGLLKFTDWPFPVGNRVQPVAIRVDRMFTNVSVHRAGPSGQFPWSDALWFLASPVTVFTLRLLPPLRDTDDDGDMPELARNAIADALQVEKTDFKYEELRIVRRRPRPTRAAGPEGSEAARLAQQVKEVLPAVPMRDILRDLASTRSVDVTITNFLEGVTPYTPEAAPRPSPSTSSPAPRYVVPVPTGSFPKSAKERQLSFQERKAQMIAEARKRYIEKHGLNVALNNC
ncbi:ancient ubiquitous protein 1-like [Trichoplusia ni]|uniref:Ancient ubiquitous protein 1-like n=1 Tax=Trichoplusia ni TaxID=7111 RepID=A0A7E5VYV4_TRINI|nr:ancient ubiquitous protein 1-like [Trichoplusia ni]